MAAPWLTALTTTKGMAVAALGVVVAFTGGSFIIKDETGRPMIHSLLGDKEPAEADKAAVSGDEAPAASTEQQADTETASLSPEPEASTPATLAEPEQAPAPPPPAFDLLRVERDGSVVIAGRAPSGSDIEIMDDGQMIATGRATVAGDFAIVLDEPLRPGDHALSIIATTPDGDRLASVETGIVTIPEADDAGQDVLAMVQQDGAASRIMQKPEALEAAPAASAPESPEPMVSETETPTEPETAPTEGAVEESQEVTTEPATETATEEAENTPVEDAEPVPPVLRPTAPVLVQAVDVEPDRMFIAGQGEPGQLVRIYIDNEFAGQVRIGTEGAFLLELDRSLEGGSYDLRADMVPANGAEVSSRASVRLEHRPVEPELEVAAADPQSEPVAPSIGAPNEEIQPPAASVDEQAADTATSEPVAAPSTQTEPESAPAMETASQAAEAPATVEDRMASADETPVIRTGRSVIIRRGDSLWKISRRMLGEGRKYTIIFAANTDQIRNPDLIYPGQVFDVPETEDGTGISADGSSSNAG